MIEGGYVVTVDAQRTVIPDARISITGDRIVSIEARTATSATVPDHVRTIDAHGKLILPGFVNCHSHTAYTVLRGAAEDRGTASLYELLFPIMALFDAANVEAFARVGMMENLRFGATTIVESTAFASSIAPVVAELGGRCVLAEYLNDIEMAPDGVDWRLVPELADEGMDRATAFIETWHGAAEGRITAMVSPTGPDSCSEALLRKSRDLADRHGLLLTTHVGGDREQLEIVKRKANGLTPVALLHENGLTGHDVIGAHCVHLTDDDMRILAETGTSVSHNPGINAKRGKVAPVKALRERGINVGLGSDNMHGNMAEVVKFAVLLNRAREHDGTFLPPADAIEMATIHGARAIGRERDLGSLEAGKLADLLIIDVERTHLQPTLDPLAAFVHTGLGSDIETVLVGGRAVVEDGRVVGGDEREAIKEAKAFAPRVWEQLALG